MSELTVHSVCTKGPIYPTLLYFHNGCPTKDFETNCAVLQDKNRCRMIAMETSELVYAGNEEEEDSGKTLILARNRITGHVRLIEVSSVDLKPLTKTDLDHLENQHELKAKHSRYKRELKKTKTRIISNAVNMDTAQTTEDSNFENLVASNNGTGDVITPPIVPKPQAPVIEPMPREIDKNFVQHKDHYEIDPDEFYVPFLNREATCLEDVYVINKIFTDDEYFQIFFELGENNYMADLHPYIKQFVANKTLSLEFTVLAVYASVLIKCLHASREEIKKGYFKICEHSKTLNAIICKRFTEHVRHENSTMISRTQAMRRKIVCHIIVCTLILNKFQLKVDSLLDAITRKRNRKALPMLISYVAATIEIGNDGAMVKLKLPLVPKIRATRKLAPKIKRDMKRKRRVREQADTDKIDPADFCPPTINREANDVENVYPVQEILSKHEYETIYNELQLNNYKEKLHPYIKSFIENKSLSLRLTVLAAYANELLKFLEVFNKINNAQFSITHLSEKLNDIFRKRFIGENKIVDNKLMDIKNKMVCDIILCLLFLNNFRVKLEDFCNAIKETYETKHVEKLVSLVGAVIVNDDEGALVELKLPLAPKKNVKNKTSKRLTDDQDLTEYYENINDPDDETKYDITEPDNFYALPINREATKLEDVYDIEKFLPQDTYKKIECELKDSNYKEDLHPCIHSLVEKKSLSDELTVLAVCASSLIKYVNSYRYIIKKANFTMCPNSKTLNKILIKGFTKIVKWNCRNHKTSTRLVISGNMRIKSICYIMVSMLILNNFRFDLEDFCNGIKETCTTKHVKRAVNLVGAVIVNGDEGTLVELKLPLATKEDVQNKTSKQLTVNQDLTENMKDPDDKTKDDIFDPDDFFLPQDTYKKIEWGLKDSNYKEDLHPCIVKDPDNETKYNVTDPDDIYALPINREATKLEDVHHLEKFLPQDTYKKIECELKNSIYKEDLHPCINKDTDNVTDPDDFYALPINRKATKLEDVYDIEKFLPQDTYKKIECELKDSNYEEDLHPCIHSFMEKKSLSDELIVLAVCASSLIKYVNAYQCKIKKSSFRICPHSKTLNKILIKGFTEIVTWKQKNHKPFTRIIVSLNMRIKSMCYIMVLMLILNNFRFKLEDFCNAIKETYNTKNKKHTKKSQRNYTKHVKKVVSLVGAVIINEDEELLVELKLPLAPKETIIASLKRPTVDQDQTEYENMINTDDEIETIDPDDFYVPPINREATEIKNVYLLDEIFSKSKYEKIYRELEKNNYSENLHPYIQSIIENKPLSSQLTVLAAYASTLLKFIHIQSWEVRGRDFKICHHSEKLNDIILKRFTEFSEHKLKYRTRSQDMKEKMVCHVIVCVLVLNNFQCKLDPLADALRNHKDIRNNKIQELVHLVGASIVDGDNGKMVQLILPLFPKPQIIKRKPSRRKTGT